MTKILTKIGWETVQGIERTATITVNGQPINKVLTPDERPEREIVRHDETQIHGEWCLAVYRLFIGQEIEFISTETGKENITRSFVVGEENTNSQADIEGSEFCGFLIFF